MNYQWPCYGELHPIVEFHEIRAEKHKSDRYLGLVEGPLAAPEEVDGLVRRDEAGVRRPPGGVTSARPGTIEREAGGRAVSFAVTDGNQTIPVTYRGVIPDTFTDSVDVVVEGRYNRNGTFVATTLLAKCASRYENAPDKYQATPGYKASKAPAA